MTATTTQPPAPSSAAQAALASARLNPVAIAYAVNMGIALLAGFGLDLSRVQVGAVTTIATALVAVVTALTARPWYVAGVTGAVASILTACAAFGLQWSPEQISGAAATLGVILMLATHQSVIPVSAARQGLTAHEILLAQTVRKAKM